MILSKDEKTVLREIRDDTKESSLSRPRKVSAARSLHMKGLVRCWFETGDNLRFAELTNMGKAYFENNPKLRNPITSTQISLIALATSILAALISLIALFK